jgi:hypothetical protein
VAAGVIADGQVSDPVGGGEAAVERAGAFGGLGGVLGHVRGDLGVRHVAVGGDRANVELAAPRQDASRDHGGVAVRIFFTVIQVGRG